MLFVFFFELLSLPLFLIFFFSLPDLLYVMIHFFKDLGVLKSPDILESFYVTILFAWNVTKKFTTMHNLLYCIIKRNTYLFFLSAFTCAFQHFSNTIWVIECLDARLTFRTDMSINYASIYKGSLIRKVRPHCPRTVGIAINLNRQAIQKFYLDTTACITL